MIIYGPTIENLNILPQVLEGLNKYEGIIPGEEELLIIAGNNCYHSLKEIITDEIYNSYSASNKEWLILNADISHQISYEDRNIIFYSLQKNNLIIRRQIKERTPVVYLIEGNLTLFDGRDELPIISIKESNLSTNKGLYSVLFIIALGFIIKLPLFILRRILKQVTASREGNSFSVIF